MKKTIAIALCGILCIASVTGCSFKKSDDSAERIEKLEKKIDKLKDEVDELGAENEYLKGENERLEEENEDLREELENVSATNDDGGCYMDPVRYRDENGNPIDLGGMEIIIRDWWSSPDERDNITNEYEEARDEYWELMEEIYNFTVIRTAISDWGNVPADFVEYTTSGGDDNNYIFVLRDDAAVTSAAQNGLMYDLSTLDCLDFTDMQYTRNMNFESYSEGDSIYSMAAGYNEPGIGVYFNKTLLEEAGIDPESIYQMQRSGEWTWEAFEDLINKSRRDTNGDGTTDIWGLAVNKANMTEAAVYSNGGQFVGKDGSRYTCEVESAATLEALEWVDGIYDWYVDDYSYWQDYQDAFINSEAAFLVEYGYAGCMGSWLETGMDELPTDKYFSVGFVAFPSGPQVRAGEYYNCSNTNPVVIPACYDSERAWKLAFVWNLWNSPAPGFEDYNEYGREYQYGVFDDNIYETLGYMCDGNQKIDYSLMIPNMKLTSQLLWYIEGDGNSAQMAAEAADEWKAYIDAAND